MDKSELAFESPKTEWLAAQVFLMQAALLIKENSWETTDNDIIKESKSNSEAKKKRHKTTSENS